jgi:hypothetical protein
MWRGVKRTNTYKRLFKNSLAHYFKQVAELNHRKYLLFLDYCVCLTINSETKTFYSKKDLSIKSSNSICCKTKLFEKKLFDAA